MAGMIEEIFGLMPSSLRLKELEELQEQAQALIKTGRVSPFAATFGLNFANQAAKGLLSRLGLETPEMTKAKANKEQADMFMQDLVAADTADRMDTLINKLVAQGASISVINSMQARADKLREQEKPIEPEKLSKQQVEFYQPMIVKAADELANIDLEKMESNDMQSYYRSVVERVNDVKAKIKTENKQGAKQEYPSNESIIRTIVKTDYARGVTSSEDKYFGLSSETKYNSDLLNRTDGLFYDPENNKVIKITEEENGIVQ